MPCRSLRLCICSSALVTLAATAELVMLDCPNQPNCVSSEASDIERRVAPLKYAGRAGNALVRLAAIVDTMAGADVVTLDQTYLRATFTSRFFRFVDDVEFVLRDGAFIDVRSMSRSGSYDFGVNRARVEKIRARFDSQTTDD